MRNATLLAWVAAFVLHRALVVAAGFDGLYFWEETYRLLVAEALLGGWPIPWHDLQADPYNAGSLVFAALVAPAAAVAGPSLVALKAVAIAWSAAGLAAWMKVAERLGGGAAARALALLWIASPPLLVVFNALGLGSHSDTATLTGLQALLLLRCLDAARAGEASLARRVAAWTFSAGVSVWFGCFAALPLALMACWALAAGVLPPRLWPLAAAAFAAGLSPWIAYNVVEGGSLDVLARVFAGGGAEGPGWLARLWDLTVRGAPAALYFRDIGVPGDVKVPRAFLAYPWLAVYALSFAILAASLARRAAGKAGLRAAVAACPEAPLVALFPALLMVLAASSLEWNDLGLVRFVTFRVLAPALPSMLLAVALAWAPAAASLRTAALGACVALGAIGTVQLVADGASARPLREAEARQTGAEAFGHLLVFKHGTDAALARERVAALPPELRASAWRGVGFGYAWLYGTRHTEAPASQLEKDLGALGGGEALAAAIDGARAALTTGLAQVAPLAASRRSDEIRAAVEGAATTRP